MPEWGDWGEVKLLVQELIRGQDKRIDDIQDSLKWLVRAVIGALLGILLNAALNIASLHK